MIEQLIGYVVYNIYGRKIATPCLPTTFSHKVSIKFSLLNVTIAPADSILLKMACTRSSCSSCVLPYTKTWSILCTITPSRSARTLVTRHWKCSCPGALLIPNVSLFLPNGHGVTNVVRSLNYRDLPGSATAVKLAKYRIPPTSLLRFSSTVSKVCTSLKTFL